MFEWRLEPQEVAGMGTQDERGQPMVLRGGKKRWVGDTLGRPRDTVGDPGTGGIRAFWGRWTQAETLEGWVGQLSCGEWGPRGGAGLGDAKTVGDMGIRGLGHLGGGI